MKNGIFNIENLTFEELAGDRAYEFLFVSTPIRFKGATGSPVGRSRSAERPLRYHFSPARIPRAERCPRDTKPSMTHRLALCACGRCSSRPLCSCTIRASSQVELGAHRGRRLGGLAYAPLPRARPPCAASR